MKTAALLTLLALALPVAAGQVYRWTDAKGNVHFSDQPPPADVKTGTQKQYSGNVPDGNASTAGNQTAKAKAVLFVSANCGTPCERAKAHLAKRGVTYTTRDASTDVEANETLRASNGKARVPTLMIGTQKLEGFNAAAWDSALDGAGLTGGTTVPAPAAEAAAPKTTR